jgi:LemA protein
MKIKVILIVAAIVVSVILMTVFGFQGIQNKAISYEEQIATAQSEITVQEKRRADLIPNLVNCVKGYDTHEYHTLMDIVEARGTSSDDVVEEVQTIISAIAEAYPELKSNENYKQLMTELATTENLIANYRSSYNNWVKRYNQYVRKFPAKQVLGMLGYEVVKYDYLEYKVDAPVVDFE